MDDDVCDGGMGDCCCACRVVRVCWMCLLSRDSVCFFSFCRLLDRVGLVFADANS